MGYQTFYTILCYVLCYTLYFAIRIIQIFLCYVVYAFILYAYNYEMITVYPPLKLIDFMFICFMFFLKIKTLKRYQRTASINSDISI